MPLWVDPLAAPIQRKIKLAALMIPAIASALTLLVVFYCWTIPDAFAGLTGIDYVRYVLYYLLSAGLFIYGFQRIRSAIRTMYPLPRRQKAYQRYNDPGTMVLMEAALLLLALCNRTLSKK